MSPLLLSALLTLAACGGGEPGKTQVDADGDGSPAGLDCDDNDPTRAPGFEDAVGDGLDQNCDGVDGVDSDGDGVASADSGGGDCDDDDPSTLGTDNDDDGYASCADCDDSDPTLSPGAPELCDGYDNTCDGLIDRDAEGTGVCELQMSVLDGTDILFVVDNSCSMSEEQASVAQSAPLFLDTLLGSSLDYHLGVISTDVPSDQGRLAQFGGVKWVDPATANPSSIFQNMVQRGTGGSADERGADAVYEALETQLQPGGFNEGFVRNEAHLDIVFLSDEDDHSAVAPGTFVSWLDALKPPSAQVRIHTIVSPDPVCPTGAEPGTNYLALATQFPGYSASICDSPWDQLMVDLASTVPAQPSAVFYLEVAVDPTSLAAEVLDGNGASIVAYAAEDLVWDDVEGSLTLPDPVQVGESVVVRYARP